MIDKLNPQAAARNPQAEAQAPDPAQPEAQAEQLPPKIKHAYLFQGFNAASWQIALGSPLILFARELGAPAVILGLLAGLSPLTSILQLAVAKHAERIGYRNLMLRGWSMRVMVLVFMVVLPLLAPVIGYTATVYATLAVMTTFTVSRAIAVCSWMPWVASIVPRSLRGYYLSRDRMAINIATLLALVISGAVLQGHNMWGYAVVFLMGFLGGAVSLYFLNRIPSPPEQKSQAGGVPAAVRVSWRSLLSDDPFRRLMMFSSSVQLVVAASNTFVVVFVREQVGYGDGTILWFTAAAAVMSMLALTLLRRRADRWGSKPFLAFVLMGWAVLFGSWFLLSVKAVPYALLIAPGLLLFNGFVAATYDLALTRLLMNIAGDRPASAQYFALHSVVVSAVAGLAPVVWGFALDNLGAVGMTLGPWSLSRFSYLFGLQWLLLGPVAFMLSRVRESNAQTVRRVAYEAFVLMPARAITRVVPTLSHLIHRVR